MINTVQVKQEQLTKLIPLTQGKFAKVSECDFEELNKYKWAVAKFPRTSYAVRYSCKNGKQKSIYMHRQILGLTERNQFADHVNHDGLDNTRDNLRVVSPHQNLMNRSPKRNSSSKFIGVCWHKKDKKWQSSITINKKQIHLGQFDCEIQAAKCRDEAAIKHYGKFANLNLKQND